MDNALVREFPPQTLDKVDRLLDLLAELSEHPLLKDKLALHGGTAINLFMLNIPRLSVDIHEQIPPEAHRADARVSLIMKLITDTMLIQSEVMGWLKPMVMKTHATIGQRMIRGLRRSRPEKWCKWGSAPV